jgi:glucose-6-phosphate dehydrogenase assembly protein OpcA
MHGKLTGLLADVTWVPIATVHFSAMTGALLAGWMAVRLKVNPLRRVIPMPVSDSISSTI